MKVTQSLLPLAALLSAAIAAPTSVPTEGVSFPITDLIDSDLTVKEYAESLEKSNLAKRQFNSETFNQLTDGTACRPISVIWARGTTSPGNVGEVGSEGPSFFNALASSVGGASRLAIQGVNYSGTSRPPLSGTISDNDKPTLSVS
jgi:cutinase